jgi:hypothetical protein
MYASDHDGYQPNHSPSLPDKAVLVWKQAMTPYLKDGNVVYCPSDKDARTPREKIHASSLHSSYWGSYKELVYWEKVPDGKIADGTKVRLNFALVKDPSVEIYLLDRELEIPIPESLKVMHQSYHGTIVNGVAMDGSLKTLPATP